MSRISIQATAKAVAAIQKLTLTEKEALCDELFKTQPDIFFLILGLSQDGVSLVKADYALHLLLIIYRAMTDAGITGRVSRKHIEKSMKNIDGLLGFLQGGASLQEMMLTAHSSPEVNLLAFITGDMKDSGLMDGSEESCILFTSIKTVLDSYALVSKESHDRNYRSNSPQ
jgi:hypothetical protein